MPRPETLTDKKGAAFPTLVVPGLGAPNFHTDWIAARLEREGLDAVKLKFPWMALGDMNRSVFVAAPQDSIYTACLAAFTNALLNFVAVLVIACPRAPWREKHRRKG